MLLFPFSSLENLVASISDHTPILICNELVHLQQLGRRFKFENAWLREPGLREVVVQAWQGSCDQKLLRRLYVCSERLKFWGGRFIASLRKDIKGCNKKIEELQYKSDAISIQWMEEVKVEYASLLLKEDDFWKQRAKNFLLVEGDLNSRFFHSMASDRKKTNRIIRLQDVDGVWCDNGDEICDIALSYFTELFSVCVGKYDPVISCVKPLVSSVDNEMLLAPFTIEEFRTTLFQMHPDKSPGPEDFNLAFYQKFWDLVNKEVSSACMEWVEKCEFPSGFNDTHCVGVEMYFPSYYERF